VRVPTCAHSEHEVGGPLGGTCSACAEKICTASPGCCSGGWDAACVAAADGCADSDTSAAASSRAFSAVVTGWIEAPTTGSYVFESAGLPSRLFVNGSPILDWFAGAGTTSGSITLQRGGKYHLRWDRYQAGPLGGAAAGLTWQLPGTVGQTAIPSSFLYRVTPAPAPAGRDLLRPGRHEHLAARRHGRAVRQQAALPRCPRPRPATPPSGAAR
jgi:hypothetical protein